MSKSLTIEVALKLNSYVTGVVTQGTNSAFESSVTVRYIYNSLMVTKTYNSGLATSQSVDLPLDEGSLFKPGAYVPSACVFTWDGSGGRTTLEASYVANTAKLSSWREKELVAIAAMRSKILAAPTALRIVNTSIMAPSSQGAPFWIVGAKLGAVVATGSADSWVATATALLDLQTSINRNTMIAEYAEAMNTQQNDVLDQLIALHPTVVWNNVVVTDDAIFGELNGVCELFAAEGAYAESPLGELFNWSSQFKFLDALPTTPMGLDEAKLFFATKLNKALVSVVNVIAGSMHDNVPPGLKDFITSIIYADMVDALLARTLLGTDAAASSALKAYAHTDAVYTASVKQNADLAVSNDFYAQFARNLTEGSGYARGTFVLAPSSQYYHAVDVFGATQVTDLCHAAGVHKMVEIPSRNTAREERYMSGIEAFLLCLARGELVVGYPSDWLFPTFANAARGHGFNVVILEHDTASVAKWADLGYQRMLDKGSAQLVQALRSLSRANYVKLEQNRSGMLVTGMDKYVAGYTYFVSTLEHVRQITTRSFNRHIYADGEGASS